MLKFAKIHPLGGASASVLQVIRTSADQEARASADQEARAPAFSPRLDQIASRSWSCLTLELPLGLH